MKYALLVVLIWGSLAAEDKQPVKPTITNLDKEEAPYVPDDSLPYVGSWPGDPKPAILTPVLLVPVVVPVVETPFIGGFVGGYRPNPTRSIPTHHRR